MITDSKIDKVQSRIKAAKVTNIYEGICKRLGFTQNIIGMKFMSGKILMEIVDIKTRNRKYPILTTGSNGKSYKHTVGQVKTLIGGDKIINRNANLDKILS